MTTSTSPVRPRVRGARTPATVLAHLVDLGRCYVVAVAGVGVLTAVIAVGWLVPLEWAMALATTVTGAVLLVTGGGIVRLRDRGHAVGHVAMSDRSAVDDDEFGGMASVSSLGVALLVGFPLVVLGCWMLAAASPGR